VPFSEDAERLFSFCESGKIEGFVTPVICSNSYYLLRKTAKHEKVIEKLSQLLTIMDVLSMNKDIVIQALRSDFSDFEDALQNFSAIKSGFIQVIVTRNVKDFAKSDVGVMTPGDYLRSLTSGWPKD
jgi:hypothetical protein